MENPPATLHDLPAAALSLITQHLSAHDCAMVALAAPSLHAHVQGDDLLWRQHLYGDFLQREPLDPWGQLQPTSREAYRLWRTEFPYSCDTTRFIKRSIRAWGEIKAFAAQHFPQLLGTFRPGASEHTLQLAGQAIGKPLPPALKAIYRIHDGQALLLDAYMDMRKRVPGAGPALAACKQHIQWQRGVPGKHKFGIPPSEEGRQREMVSLDLQLPGSKSTSDAAATASEVPSSVPQQAQQQQEERREEQQSQQQSQQEQQEGHPEQQQQQQPHPHQQHGHTAGNEEEGEEEELDVDMEDEGMEEFDVEELDEDADDGMDGDLNSEGLEEENFAGVRPPSSLFHGMFGGYSFYDHLVCLRLLPIIRSAFWTTHIMQDAGGEEMVWPVPYIVVAATFDLQRKGCAVNLDTGDVMCGPSLEPSPAHPDAASSAVNAMGRDSDTFGDRDGVLRWFEEYASRLSQGWYEAAPLSDYPLDKMAISLFPMKPPIMVTAVTRGVQVRATVIYAPEAAGGMFSYSIRFSLLPEDEQLKHWPATAGPPRLLTSVQLQTRHWIIRDREGVPVDEVRGEGVVGKFPILRPGGKEFVYQSCTGGEERGSMDGDFRFVEGTISHPTGPELDVICPRFQLEQPSFLF